MYRANEVLYLRRVKEVTGNDSIRHYRNHAQLNINLITNLLNKDHSAG